MTDTTILLIDDIDIHLKMLDTMLSGSDYRLLKAGNGVEAIHVLEENPEIDTILVDLEMPVMDGYKFISYVRQNPKWLTVPVIVITGSASEVNRTLIMGANDFISKPFNREELRLRVMNQVRNKKASDALKVSLKKSEARLEQLFQSTDQGVYSMDMNGNCTFINRPALMKLGYRIDECIGKNIHTLIHHSYPDGSLFPEENCSAHKALLNTQSYQSSNDILWKKDGSSFPVDISSNPLMEDGVTSGAVVTFSDITTRRRFEIEQLKLTRAVEQSPVTTVITDTSGSIEFVNPKFTELTGYTLEEAVGQNPRILSSGQTPPETYVDLWATVTSGNTWKGEFLNKAKDGTLFWEMASISPLYDENGCITHYLAVKEDITEKKLIIEQLKAAKVQAEAANEAKSEFLAIMSHEIRTPMNGVVGMSSLLLETELNAEQRDYAEIVSRSGENLLVLIDAILDFSIIEADKLELENAYFDLQLLLDDINRLFAYRADDKGLVLTYTVEPGMPILLKGDPGRVRQIITNLVGNALKFTEHGAVAVTASLVSEQNGSVVIKFAVRDTGIGIPESRLSAVFAPFTQVDASTTRKYGGTGLGLTICRRLAELMGGEIGVTSEEGKGSTFWFTVRLEKQIAEALKTAQESAPQAQPVTSGGVADSKNLTARILLAEDNPINQRVALHMLKSLGYAADAAADGQLAVEALTKNTYDLVLMDCMMPNMSGFEATGIIRAESSEVLDHNVPIIAMTANAMKGDRDKCLEAGMDDYVAKPVKKDVLAAVLEKWLSPARLQQRKNIDVDNKKRDKLSRLTVLYVEDEETTRELYSLFLSDIVGVLITAKNGAEGLEAYHKHHPDIIITDIVMPVMDGLEMLKQVRTSNPTIPVIVLSAFETSDSLNQSNDFGVLRYEMKTLSRTKLKVTLLECADGLLV